MAALGDGDNVVRADADSRRSSCSPEVDSLASEHACAHCYIALLVRAAPGPGRPSREPNVRVPAGLGNRTKGTGCGAPGVVILLPIPANIAAVYAQVARSAKSGIVAAALLFVVFQVEVICFTLLGLMGPYNELQR